MVKSRGVAPGRIERRLRALALGVAAIACTASEARADILYGLGPTRVGFLPPSVAPSAATDIDPPAAFLEQPSCPMTGAFAQIAAPGAYGGYGAGTPELECTIPIGPALAASHFIVRVPTTVRRAEDVLVFDAPIVGIQTVGTCMDGTPAACRAPGVAYPPTFGAVGLGLTSSENDYVVVFPGSRVLYYRFDSLAAGDWDAMRVLTEVLPATTSDVQLGCMLTGDATVGSTLWLTLTVDTLGPGAAPDPEVVVRVPAGLRPTALPTGCVDLMGAIACRMPGPALTPGAGSVTFVIQLLVESPATARVVAFGTGAVHDPVLANNRCGIPFGAVSDGGTVGTDAGAADVDAGAEDADASAAFDSAVPAPDGGVPSADGEAAAMDAGVGLDGVSFRGGAGCVCRTSPARAGSAGPAAASILVLVALARRARRGRAPPSAGAPRR